MHPLTATFDGTDPPPSVAALLWKDESDLFEKLKRRLTSYAVNTQRALAADWRAWRSWCTANARNAFPAAPGDVVDYILAHSPPMQRTSTGEVALNPEVTTPMIRRASTVTRWLASLSTLKRLAE